MKSDRRNPERPIGRRISDTPLYDLITKLDDVILELDRSGRVLFFSKTLSGVGYANTEIVGHDFCDWADDVEHPKMRAALERVFAEGESTWYQTQSIDPESGLRWFESRLSPVVRQGEVQSVLLITTDITERKNAELMAERQSYLIQLFYKLPFIGMSITDPANRRWVEVNEKLCEILGYSREELLTSGWEDFTHPDDLAMSQHAFEQVLHGKSEGYTLEKRFVHKDGKVVYANVDVHAAPKSGEVLNQPGVDYVVATIQDISARKEQEARISHMAHHDLLTDLPNRSLLSDRLSQTLLHAKRSKTHFALLFIDLDEFKPINDAHGHATGDLLLKAAAKRMLACVRASDSVARMGGDEFVVLLSHVDGSSDAQQVANKIKTALAEPFTLENGISAQISSSIGIALYPDHGDNEEALLRCADDAMYQAKANGKDCAMVYTAEQVRP